MHERIKSPTAPEHVEVVSSDIKDEGDNVLFTFHFAKPVTLDTLQQLWDHTGRTVQKVIEEKLDAKGWGRRDPHLMNVASSSEDGKMWTLRYHRTDPDTPRQIH